MRQLNPANFSAIKIKIASEDEILSWSHGEVTKPETINYRTQRPEKDGLFCERIFGPTKDWECYCGKYRKIRYKGIICDKCGVEVTTSSVRRERMGHIKLVSPVTHIWFLRGVPSKIGLLLDLSVNDLEKVIYFSGYIITKINEKTREEVLNNLNKEYKLKLKSASREEKKKIKQNFEILQNQLKSISVLKVISEIEYLTLSRKFGEVFEAGIGSEILRKICEKIDLKKLLDELNQKLKNTKSLERKKLIKRIRVVKGFLNANIRPEWMFLTVLPVLPPDLRPMVALDGGRYASSDLNDLYRRVINRNNRLKKLIELNAPEVIIRNEKRMLQEAVDALIDNSIRKTQMVTASTGQKRLLKSLADILRGKEGRFRQNLLGKRVDYSARSVIVVGPELKLDQCGLPKKMALELFKPFVIQKIIERELAYNVRGANYLIGTASPEIWAILEEVIQDRYVLLNRAPTLHRLGIQAFKPILVEGLAIQIHPMVCKAFNADFDGDQMAVHLPLTKDAQDEAKNIMLSSKNLLAPATSRPIVIPTQDIVLGCYWLTQIYEGEKGENLIFSSIDEVRLAYEFGKISLKAKIKIPIKYLNKKEIESDPSDLEGNFIKTSFGRLIFNEVFPEDFKFVNKEFNSKLLENLVTEIIEKYGEDSKDIFDKIKALGFEYSTISGISWGKDDLIVPKEKPQLIKSAEREVELVKSQYEKGLLTDRERYERIIAIWHKTKEQIAKLVPQTLNPRGPIYSILASGARGSWAQPTQMAGMKGLVSNPAGEIIELPIKSSFKEGFNILEYFISTHGARKGTADTALRTASAGYLTRRLVDVAQDLIIYEEDCGDNKGIIVYKKDCEEIGESFIMKIFGRYILTDLEIVDKDGSKIFIKKGEIITHDLAKKIEQDANINQIRVRSPIECKSKKGLCQKCYGYDLGRNKLIELGEAVGIIAAQAIGEPGTQLTMRTFHTGGVAGGGDITQGLPRVEEIFEARSPKVKALISEVDGEVIDIISDEKGNKLIKIKDKKTRKKIEYKVIAGLGIWVAKGDKIAKGQQLSEGYLDLKELLKISDKSETVRYIIKEIQKVYCQQGVQIHDKHLEVIIKKMFSKVKIKDPQDSDLLQDTIVDKIVYELESEEIKSKGGNPPKIQQLIMGIKKVALLSESFLSAASFQETARVLIDAASMGQKDELKGLKENVIIGRLIPAGTGFRKKKE